MARIKDKNTNLLDYIPVQKVQWEQDEEKKVILKVPKTRNRLMISIIKAMKKSIFTKVHLDEFGSFVWIQCDGKASVEQIGEKLKNEFGDSVDPVYERLGAFIKILAYQKYITYQGNINS
jgi:hypothetical protein